MSKCYECFVLKTVLITISNISELHKKSLHIGDVCVTFYTQFLVLGTFEKLQKATISSDMSGVHSKNNLDCHEI